jgi:hypothetical protein
MAYWKPKNRVKVTVVPDFKVMTWTDLIKSFEFIFENSSVIMDKDKFERTPISERVRKHLKVEEVE